MKTLLHTRFNNLMSFIQLQISCTTITNNINQTNIIKRFYSGGGNKGPRYLKKLWDMFKFNNKLVPKLMDANVPSSSKIITNKNIPTYKIESIDQLNNNFDSNQISGPSNNNLNKDEIFPKQLKDSMSESFSEKAKKFLQQSSSQAISQEDYINNLYPSLKQKHLLLSSFEHKDYVSGILTLTPKERELLFSDSILGQEFRKILVILACKTNLHFRQKKGQLLEEILQEAFGSIYKKTSYLSMSKDLEKIIGERIITFIQHFIVLLWNPRKFTTKELMHFCQDHKEIKISSFKEIYDITILSFCEAANVKELLKLLKNANISVEDFSFNMTNPEHISDLPLYFSNIESLEQTGQKNADILIGWNKDNYSNFGDNFFKIYLEIKSFMVVLNIDKRRFSLIHGSEKLFKRLFNEMVVALQRNLDNKEVMKFYKNVLEIKKETNIGKDQYTKLLYLIMRSMFVDKSYNIKAGFCIDIGEMEPNLAFSFEVIKRIEDFTKTEKAIAILEKMFPRIPLIDNKANIENLLALFEEVDIIFADNFKQITLL